MTEKSALSHFLNAHGMSVYKSPHVHICLIIHEYVVLFIIGSCGISYQVERLGSQVCISYCYLWNFLSVDVYFSGPLTHGLASGRSEFHSHFFVCIMGQVLVGLRNEYSDVLQSRCSSSVSVNSATLTSYFGFVITNKAPQLLCVRSCMDVHHKRWRTDNKW